MSVKLRGLPHFSSFRRRRSFTRYDLLNRAAVCAAVKLCRSTAIVLATLCLAQAGSVLAQTSAQEPLPLAAQLLAQSQTPSPDSTATGSPTAGVMPDKAAKSLEMPSPWDAPVPWRTDRFYFQFAYYTIHFHYDADHQQSYLFDAEYHFKETWLGGQWIAGMALFQNSFGQFSQYLFGGLVWRPIESEQPFYVKLTAGPLHGYSGQYKDKIPMNSSGVAPAIIPGVGYCVQKRYCGEFVLLGTNAALLTIGMTVP